MPRRAPLALVAAAALLFPATASAAGKVVVGYRDGHMTVFRPPTVRTSDEQGDWG